MPLRQITIIGTGLIGGSFSLALKRRGFKGRIVGCDHLPVLQKALKKGIISVAESRPVAAVRGSQIILLATPVGAILELIRVLGPGLAPSTLLTDVGSTKVEVVAQARKVFGKDLGDRFLGGHPMAGKEQFGIEFADPDLFHGTTWFITPVPGRRASDDLRGEFLKWIDKIGAHATAIDPETHDQICAWISHLPQMVSTALAAALVEEFGKDGRLLESGGRALREMTRVSASPYSVWRDIALTNKNNIRHALLQMEQRLAHMRENLNSRELEAEFERAHRLRKLLACSPRGTQTLP
jgi:prephenate dehydrogenase